MKLFVSLLLLSFTLSTKLSAQTIERDSFDVGVEAFNAGNCQEALRIMKKYEKQQSIAAYVVRVCSLILEKKDETTISYQSSLNSLYNGDPSQFDKIAMIERFSEKINGFSGAMYVHTLRTNAQRDNVLANFQMGQLYQEGTGVKLNFNTAAHYFQKAAEQDHAEALNILGVYYRFGIGVKKDEKKAEELLKKAVLKKNLNAFFNLGQLYADQKDYLQSWILSDLAVKEINPKTERKKYDRIKDLLIRAKKHLSPLQTAYLEKFRPFWLKPVLSRQDLNQFTAPQELPLPPQEMIEETPFMKFVRKDAFDNKYKTFYPLMPSWTGFSSNGEKNPDLIHKNPPAPAPEDPQTISALYFRPSDPRFIHVTLQSENSSIPVMVGDILTLTVYTPLYENKTTLKGGHMYIQNTGYRLNIRDPEGILVSNSSFVLTPLSEQTARQESWLSRKLIIRKEGSALINFVPQTVPDGKKIFPHSIKIVAVKGKAPK